MIINGTVIYKFSGTCHAYVLLTNNVYSYALCHNNPIQVAH